MSPLQLLLVLVYKTLYLYHEHPDSPLGTEKIHHILVQLVEVEGVDALLGPHQDVLVPRLWVDPAGRAVDL